MIAPRNPSSFAWPVRMATFGAAALLILVGLGLLPRTAVGQQKIQTVEGITEYRLDNDNPTPFIPDDRRRRRVFTTTAMVRNLS